MVVIHHLGGRIGRILDDLFEGLDGRAFGTQVVRMTQCSGCHTLKRIGQSMIQQDVEKS
jgi:hypothetical protein